MSRRALRDVGRLLDYCRRSANPVGRLVLRIAGYHDARLDRSVRRGLHGAAADELLAGLRARLARRAACTSRSRMSVARAREEDLDRRRDDAAWRGGARRGRHGARGRCSSAGRAVCDGVNGRLRCELRFTWLGGRRILERARGASGSTLLHRRPALGAADMPLLVAGARLAPAKAIAQLMARNTNFYYSFLVLPAEKRRAIVAVWDFCRAVDDAVDEAPVEAAAAKPGGDARSAAGARSSRAATGAARRRRRRGRGSQPFVRRFDLPRRAFDERDRRRRDGSRSARATRRSTTCREYCRARRVRGRADLRPRSSATGTRGRATTRPTWASRCSSPTSCATCATTWRAAASTCRSRTSTAFGCAEDDLRGRAPGRAGARACWRSSARAPASIYDARRGAAAARRTGAGWWPPRSWARIYREILRPHRAARLRRVHRARRACRARARRWIAAAAVGADVALGTIRGDSR